MRDNDSETSLSTYYRWAHEHVLTLVEDLSAEQVDWRPATYSISIAFHLWHLARWQITFSTPFSIVSLVLTRQTVQPHNSGKPKK